MNYERRKQLLKEGLIRALSDPLFLADDSFKGKLSGYSTNTTVQNILQYGTPLSDYTIANRIRHITYVLYSSNGIAKFPSTITFVFDGNRLSHQIIDSKYFNYDTSKGYAEVIPTVAYYDHMDHYLRLSVDRGILTHKDVVEICLEVKKIFEEHVQRRKNRE